MMLDLRLLKTKAKAFISFLGLLLFVAVLPAMGQIDDLIHQRVGFSIDASKTNGSYFSAASSTSEYNGLIISGTANGDFLNGFVRFQNGTGWSDWKPLQYLNTSTQTLFLAGYRSDTFYADTAFELRFDTAPGVRITLNDVGVFDNRIDDDFNPPAEIPQQKSLNGSAAIFPPQLIPRGEWGAENFVGNPVPLARPSYNRMTFHHAACCGARTYQEGITQVKGIQDFHQDVRGWSDIGYHFVFDQSGRLYQGRPFLDNRTNLSQPPVLAQGAHVGGFNTGNIGIALLGCYHPPEGGDCLDEMSPALRDSVVTLYAYLNERYGVSTSNLFGHRDQTATSCPGDNNYTLLPALRTEINELVAAGNQPIARASIQAANGTDGVIQLSWSFSEVFDVVSYQIDREVEINDAVISTPIFQAAVTDGMIAPASAVDANLETQGTVQYGLYATSSSGVVQRLALAEADLALATEFILGENFPNPFSNQTTIRYFLVQDGIVRINVFDANGRRVASLVDEFQDADRWYTTSFDASSLSAGTYFCQMQVEGFSRIVFDETRTLVVVK